MWFEKLGWVQLCIHLIDIALQYALHYIVLTGVENPNQSVLF